MNKKINNIINPKIFYGFCITELLVLIALKIVSSINPDLILETILMFSAILINAVFMCFLTMRVKKSGKNVAIKGLPLAAFVILLADSFLVLACDLSSFGIINFITVEACNMIGFFVFGIVQVVYAFYLGLTKRRLIVRVAFYVVFLITIYAAGLLTVDRWIACLSMTQLILNVVYAWIENNKKRTLPSLLFAIGITLFFGCDGFIMMRMLLPPEGFIYSVICFMVWVFYIPAQVVITSSYLFDRANA